MNHPNLSAHQTDFNRYMQSPLARWVNNRILHRCNQLVSLGPVLKVLEDKTGHDLGVQDVPLASIIGSSGRSRDFTLMFEPTRQSQADRWVGVASARKRFGQLPPIHLYRVGTVYFVEDGNHRVSIARAYGEKTIQARVTELSTAGLQPEPTCERLGFRMKIQETCR